MRIAVMLLAGLALLPAAAQAELLQPAGKWRVDYGDKKCIAARSFGEGKSAVLLVIEQYVPGESFRLNLVGQRFRNWSEEKNSKLRFGPDHVWQDYDVFNGNYGKDMPAVLARASLRIVPFTPDQIAARRKDEPVEIPPITDAQRVAVRTIDVRRGATGIQLATGPLDKLWAEMAKCTGLIVKSWGFDPAAMASLKSGPKPLTSPAKWLLSSDYPAGAATRGQRALVTVRLNIDAAGAVSACDILQSTRPKEFEDAVCKGLSRRARFEPAIGADGKLVPAYWAQAVTFQIG